MKNRIMRSFYAALCVFAMSVTGIMGTVQVFAAESEVGEAVTAVLKTPNGVADFGRGAASITIAGNPGQTLAGKRFKVHKLFCAENSAGMESIQYTVNDVYANALKTVVGSKISKEPVEVTEYEVIDYMQTFNTDQTEGAQAESSLEGAYSAYRYFIEELRNQIVKEKIVGNLVSISETSADNTVVIAGLDFGYYIVDEVTSVSQTHSASSMCIVNTANPKANVNIKSDYPSVVKKIQEDDNRDKIGSNGWNDIADFEIGQRVPYKYESNIPNMNGYDTYYYAWHDIMDEALTFKSDSVKIVIQETQDPASEKYELTEGEYSVITNPGDGETFKIEIQNIKEIVDREFNHMNALKENIYGQHVVLTYEAVLNDNAALDTGRPGFENDVRLEFSNDADHDHEGSTGYTPWDTVVCFTYKLNGLKTNNHNQNLDGAKFRLYSDALCKNEVYVKPAGDGYNVINRDSAGETAPPEAVEMVSHGDGEFKIYGLDGGIYYLRETEAPDGYRPLLDPIEIQISPEFTDDREHYVKGDGAADKTLKQLKATAYIKEFLSGVYKDQDIDLETNVSEGSANLTVINTVGKKLPITGSYAMLLILGAGTVMMVYALAGKKKK